MKALSGCNAAAHVVPSSTLSCNAVRVVVREEGKEEGKEREGGSRERNCVVEWSWRQGGNEARERESKGRGNGNQASRNGKEREKKERLIVPTVQSVELI